MPKAIWNGLTLAESNEGQVVEGNYYFPPQSIIRAHFQPSTTQTTCPWKGVASYYDIVVDGKINRISAGHSGSFSALRVNGGRNAATILSFK